MKTRLTLQEKLRDLRNERGAILSDVSEATGIPVSTLQRIEGNEDVRAAYQDVAALAKYYEVSADYLFGLTDHRQHRNVEIDKLHLTDEAVGQLTGKTLNNRLVSELFAHPDFPSLLRAMEVYIDRKVLPHMNTVNAMYRFAEDTIKQEYGGDESDETLQFLQQAVVDEDEYLRYRISERFNILVKSLFEAHKKDSPPIEENPVLHDMKEDVKTYLANKESPEYAKMLVLGRQLGLNLKSLSNEEIDILLKALHRSDKVKRIKKRRK